MGTCTTCGTKNNDENAIFCRKCSIPLVALCGGTPRHTNRPDSRYCAYCSAPITSRPAPVPRGIGCIARVCAWTAAVGIVSGIVHLLHHVTAGTAIGVLGAIGITRQDLDHLNECLVRIPLLLIIASYLIPGQVGKDLRAGTLWAVSNALRLLWSAFCWIGKAVWFMAEGAPEREHPKKPK